MTNAELKQIRLSMNLTQAELAKLLHVHIRTVSRWESGEWNISETKAELLEYKIKEHGLQPLKLCHSITDIRKAIAQGFKPITLSD